ncbi:putative cysteine desulfurase [bacterium BMS3Abin01]|nr:putative cysteine desulfurase [bacterium BMS3Abin01]HDY69941.1 aminotransferase class V-fold PLP-dependent enzyme [Actinomycetota bacterium]
MTVYLDNAASSCPKPPGVPEAVNDCLQRYCANPGRGAHRLAVEAARIIHRTRRKAAALLGVDDSADIIFTQNATDALNLAMKGILAAGDHVVTSAAEHNAVVRPLRALARRGVEVSWVPTDSAGLLDVQAVMDELRPQTRLAVFTHISNVTAAVQPIGDIGRALAETGVPLLVDAAQSAGAVPLNMAKMPVAMLACTGHKSLMGPQGIGLLYISPRIELNSVRQGGTGSRSQDEQDSLSRPDRYESGTLNTPGIAGLGAGMDYIASRGLVKLARHKSGLISRLQSELMEIAGVRVYGPPPGRPRGHLIAFNVGDLKSAETAAILDREFDIASRAGLHCAPGAHRAMGTLDRGVVRLSVGAFNTDVDIDAAVGAVREIAAR